jgi:hypothetical protein
MRSYRKKGIPCFCGGQMLEVWCWWPPEAWVNGWPRPSYSRRADDEERRRPPGWVNTLFGFTCSACDNYRILPFDDRGCNWYPEEVNALKEGQGRPFWKEG